MRARMLLAAAAVLAAFLLPPPARAVVAAHAPAAFEVAGVRTIMLQFWLNRAPWPVGDEAIRSPFILVHDDAQWIQNGNYRAQTGEHCCGISDCSAIPARDVQTTREGYIVRGFPVKFSDTLPSTDGQYWGCTKPGGIRCFFAPLMG